MLVLAPSTTQNQGEPLEPCLKQCGCSPHSSTRLKGPASLIILYDAWLRHDIAWKKKLQIKHDELKSRHPEFIKRVGKQDPSINSGCLNWFYLELVEKSKGLAIKKNLYSHVFLSEFFYLSAFANPFDLSINSG